MLKLLLRTGIRVSELINIRKKDIFTDDPCLYIINIKCGKNSMLYRSICIQKKHIKKEFEVLFKTSNKWIFEKIRRKSLPKPFITLLIKLSQKTTSTKTKAVHTFLDILLLLTCIEKPKILYWFKSH